MLRSVSLSIGVRYQGISISGLLLATFAPPTRFGEEYHRDAVEHRSALAYTSDRGSGCI
jgi:hypothetical protein